MDKVLGAVESTMPAVMSLSSDQQRAWVRSVLPEPEQIRQGLWAVGIPIPSGFIPHTLAYVLAGRDGIHVIDPGWDSDQSIEALNRGLAAIGARLQDVATIVVTHHHPDHLGIAARLRELTGARITLSRTERAVLAVQTSVAAHDVAAYRLELAEWGVPQERWGELVESFDRPSLVADVEPDLLVSDGDELDLAGRRLQVIATPGHTGGHICLADTADHLLFSGDHVLPGIYSGVGIGVLPGSDAIGDLLDSLDRLAGFDEFDVLPGHEYRFRGLGPRRAQIAAHHLRRSAEVATLRIDLGDAPIWEYASRVTWTGGWGRLSGFHLHSALRQTAMHLEFVRSGRAAAHGVVSPGR